jgi:hypothetical protein
VWQSLTARDGNNVNGGIGDGKKWAAKILHVVLGREAMERSNGLWKLREMRPNADG